MLRDANPNGVADFFHVNPFVQAGTGYFEYCLPIVEEHLKLAGIRLGAALDQIFARAD